jgi:hypothetical protein
MPKTLVLRVLPVVAAWVAPLPVNGHHEAIFGPQSSSLISQKRFVSMQYYFTNQGKAPADARHSHIGVLTASTSIGNAWSISASLPFEAERAGPERTSGLHDPVFGLRYFPTVGQNKTAIVALTLEPPASSLEHRAVGTGAGVIYGFERGHWSVITYGLGRTELPVEKGEKRGNRLFFGSGVAYETRPLPFSPQLGISWEHVGRRREQGVVIQDSNTSAVMLHPTLVKTFRAERLQTFVVVSLPVAQSSGAEGWQRFRIAAGVVWAF